MHYPIFIKEVHIEVYCLLRKHEYFGRLCAYVSKWTHAFIRMKIILKERGDNVFIVCYVIKRCYKSSRSLGFWTASRAKTIEGADLLIWIFGPVVCSHTCLFLIPRSRITVLIFWDLLRWLDEVPHLFNGYSYLVTPNWCLGSNDKARCEYCAVETVWCVEDISCNYSM